MNYLAKRWDVLNGLRDQVTMKLKSSLGDYRDLVHICIFICQSVYERVYHLLSRYISFIFNSVKRSHPKQKPSRVGFSFILFFDFLAGIFEISDQNPDVNLAMMICNFYVMMDWLVSLLDCLFVSGLNHFCELKEMIEI